MNICAFSNDCRSAVIGLWERTGLVVSWHEASADIDRKELVQPELFLVGTHQGRLAGSAMGGYDGRRGWIRYRPVEPDYRGRGWGRRLVERIAHLLGGQGCVKLAIMARSSDRWSWLFSGGLGLSGICSFGSARSWLTADRDWQHSAQAGRR